MPEEKKELSRSEVITEKPKNDFNLFGSDNLLIFFFLGLTIAIINDFFDLVTWNQLSLIPQTLDITSLLLLLFLLIFSSRAVIFSVFLVFMVFILELLPVIGVFPWWTLGIVIWYLVARK